MLSDLFKCLPKNTLFYRYVFVGRVYDESIFYRFITQAAHEKLQTDKKTKKMLKGVPNFNKKKFMLQLFCSVLQWAKHLERGLYSLYYFVRLMSIESIVQQYPNSIYSMQ